MGSYHISTQHAIVDQLGCDVQLKNSSSLISCCVKVVLGHCFQSNIKKIPRDIKNALIEVKNSCDSESILLHRLKKAIDNDDPIEMNNAYKAIQHHAQTQPLSIPVDKIYTINISQVVYGVGPGINNSEIKGRMHSVKSKKCIEWLLSNLTAYATNPATPKNITYALNLLDSHYSGLQLDHWIDDDAELDRYHHDLLLIRQKQSSDFTCGDVGHGELVGYEALKAICHNHLQDCRKTLMTLLNNNRLALKNPTVSGQIKMKQKRQRREFPPYRVKKHRITANPSSSNQGALSNNDDSRHSFAMVIQNLLGLRLPSSVSSGLCINNEADLGGASQLMSVVNHSVDHLVINVVTILPIRVNEKVMDGRPDSVAVNTTHSKLSHANANPWLILCVS